MNDAKTLAEKFGKDNTKIILDQALNGRKIVDDQRLTDKNGVEYKEFTQEFDGKKYHFKPSHVTVDEVSKFGNPRCNSCFGKGYMILEIPKNRLKGPADHVLLSKEPFENASESEKEKLIEMERLSKTWRVLLPCNCAVKRMSKEDPNFFVSDDKAIMFHVDYEEKAE